MPVVVETDRKPYERLARDIAADRETELVRSVDDATEGTLWYVSSPDELAEERLLTLQERLQRQGPRRGGFGIITGSTVEEARALYERTAGTTGENLVILRKEDRRIRSEDETTEVLTRQEATVSKLSAGSDDRLESLSLVTDGRSIHTYLSDGYLCGVPSEWPDEGVDTYPPCVDDGGRHGDCPKGEMIRADDVAVDQIFFNSCSSMNPANSSNGLPVHVGMRLLSNCRSLIGGYRPQSAISEEAALHYAMYRAGYNAAERCFVLNRNARELGIEPYPYCVFGDPTAAAPAAGGGEYDLSISRSDGRIEVTAEGVSAHVLDFTVDLPDETAPVLRNDRLAHEEWPILYTSFETDDGVRFLVYSWSEMDVDAFRFSVDSGGVREKLARVEATISGFEDLRPLGFADKKMEGQYANLKNQYTGSTELLDECRYRTNAVNELDDRVETMLGSVDQLFDRLTGVLRRRGPGFFFDDYEDEVLVEELTVPDEECPGCGRQLFVKRATDIRESIERKVGFCPRCVNVFDHPADRTAPEVGLVDDGGDRRFSIEVTNRDSYPSRVRFFPWLWSNDQEIRGADVFGPEYVDEVLRPGESKRATFSADFSGVPDGSYSVYAYAIKDLEVLLATEKVYL